MFFLSHFYFGHGLLCFPIIQRFSVELVDKTAMSTLSKFHGMLGLSGFNAFLSRSNQGRVDCGFIATTVDRELRKQIQEG